ncbi:unnamed protein product [Cuscuta campestris]|uniref:DCD domain-containing protein n=1 Tax=Cuscuta campestris TaxID=132261 RepID=A0A484M3V6_9ASTE|nr:unnamed protein product [Cuscuta campestris]
MDNIIAPASAISHASSLGFEHAAAHTTSEDEEKKGSKTLPGFIFLCNGRSKPECYQFRVFGLPLSKVDVVEKIKTGTKLFLFDFDLKLLYGVYEATSNGQVGLEPLAFGGKFPAQVQFRIYKGCLPLHETSFKHAIKDNYKGSKFKQELDEHQVTHLTSLFRPLSEASSSAAPIPPANICSTLPNMDNQKGIHLLPMKQHVQHSPTLRYGEDPYATKIEQVHFQNIQMPQHGWQGNVPVRDHGQFAIHQGFSAPSERFNTADCQSHFAPSHYPYHTANPNLMPPILQYTADAQERNIAAHIQPYPSHESQKLNVNVSDCSYYTGSAQQPDNTTSGYPYYKTDSQQVNCAALSHQYYSTGSLDPNVAVFSRMSYAVNPQQLNTTAYVQQYCSMDPQPLNVVATSHPCYTGDPQLGNGTAPAQPYCIADSHQDYVINGSAQLRQECYIRSVQEAVPQNSQPLPEQMHHQAALVFNSNPILPTPYLMN